MIPKKLGHSFVGVLCFTAVLALPSIARAQVVQQPFTAQLTDPCTGNNIVVIEGIDTTSIITKVTPSGQLHLDISDVFKGTGHDAVLTDITYTYSDNANFNFNVSLPLDPNATQDSTFTDKIFVKGSKSLDNWTIKATITFKVNAQGTVTKDNVFTSDVCKG